MYVVGDIGDSILDDAARACTVTAACRSEVWKHLGIEQTCTLPIKLPSMIVACQVSILYSAF